MKIMSWLPIRIAGHCTILVERQTGEKCSKFTFKDREIDHNIGDVELTTTSLNLWTEWGTATACYKGINLIMGKFGKTILKMLLIDNSKP